MKQTPTFRVVLGVQTCDAPEHLILDAGHLVPRNVPHGVGPPCEATAETQLSQCASDFHGTCLSKQQQKRNCEKSWGWGGSMDVAQSKSRVVEGGKGGGGTQKWSLHIKTDSFLRVIILLLSGK